MKALYVRLTLATALLLSLLGTALLALMAGTSEQYAAEVRQRLDAGIAMYVVRELHLLEQGKVNEAALRELANRAMTVNPSAEVYLLDPKGRVLSAGSQPLPRGRTAVGLEPILQFLHAPEKRPLFGDDPTSATRQRVFSVAPISEGGDGAHGSSRRGPLLRLDAPPAGTRRRDGRVGTGHPGWRSQIRAGRFGG
jgi:two-component system OmpR family sensor kinase